MDITRRQFNVVAGSVIALTVLQNTACGRSESQPANTPVSGDSDDVKSGKLTDKPFTIGKLDGFKTAGLYKDAADKGVWLYSDGKQLVAICAACTHLRAPVTWKPKDQQFLCPSHGSRFTIEGTNKSSEQKAKRPLDRCGIDRIDTPDGLQVQIDPTKIFRSDKFDDPGAFLTFPS